MICFKKHRLMAFSSPLFIVLCTFICSEVVFASSNSKPLRSRQDFIHQKISLNSFNLRRQTSSNSDDAHKSKHKPKRNDKSSSSSSAGQASTSEQSSQKEESTNENDYYYSKEVSGSDDNSEEETVEETSYYNDDNSEEEAVEETTYYNDDNSEEETVDGATYYNDDFTSSNSTSHKTFKEYQSDFTDTLNEEYLPEGIEMTENQVMYIIVGTLVVLVVVGLSISAYRKNNGKDNDLDYMRSDLIESEGGVRA